MKETDGTFFEDVNSLPTPMSPLSRDIARGRRQRLHELGMLRTRWALSGNICKAFYFFNFHSSFLELGHHVTSCRMKKIEDLA